MLLPQRRAIGLWGGRAMDRIVEQRWIRRKWIVLALLVGATGLLLGASFFTYHNRGTYICPVCGSRKHESQWRFGEWMGPSLALSSKRSELEVSHRCRDLFDEDHEHTWVFMYGSASSLGRGGLADGGGRPGSNILSMRYERDPAFRQWIGERLETGEMTKEEARRLMRREPDRGPAGERDRQQIEQVLAEYEGR